MKKLFIFCFVLIPFLVIGQNAVPTQKQIKTFLKSTTYVVLDQSMFGTIYNEKIKSAMKKHWKLTKYEFITKAEYTQKRKNSKASFLAKTEVVFKNDKNKIKYQFLNLMLGVSSARVTAMPDLANFPLDYAENRKDNYSYKLGVILIFLQNHIKLLQENPKLTEKNIIRYYNSQRTQIHDKTLYVLKEELAPNVNSINKISTYYKFPVKIVEQKDIENAINNKNANIVFFHVVRPEKENMRKERCYKIILGASDSYLYYWSMDKISNKKPSGILIQDFKKLQK